MGDPNFPSLIDYGKCRQEETRIVSKGKLHGDQHAEIQALTTHAKKGKCKGIKFHDRKNKSGGSRPITRQNKNKKLTHSML